MLRAAQSNDDDHNVTRDLNQEIENESFRATRAISNLTMQVTHNLLKRQVKRHFGSTERVPREWEPFVDAINDAYLQADDDRRMLERSLELTSQELLGANLETRAVFERLMHTSPDGILIVAENDRILAFNERFAEMWGLSADEMQATSAGALRNAVQEQVGDFEGWIQSTAEIYAQRDARSSDEIEMRDGRVFERFSSPVNNVEGVYLGRVWFFHDVTERKKSQFEFQRQNAYLNALQETALGLMQRLDLTSLLQDIVARAGALVGTENGYVFLRDPEGDEIELRVGVGAYEGFVGRRTRRGVGLAGQVWASNAPIVVDDYRAYSGRLADPSRDILRGVVGLPLHSRDEVIGVIGLAYLDEGKQFGDAEIQVLQRFAQLATIALDNARLYETAQAELRERARAENALAQQLRESELLNRVTNHAVNVDVDTALTNICADLAEYFQLEQAGIALFDEDKTMLTVVAAVSPEGAADVIGYQIPVKGNPSTEIVLETRQPAAFSDAQNDPRLTSVHELMRVRRTASILIAPLFVRDEIIGTLGIDSSQRRDFTKNEIDLVQRTALSIAAALENARLFRAAQQELAERRRVEREMRQRNHELEVVSRVSAVMTTNIDVIPALENLAREMVQTFHARNCGIALLDDERKNLTVVADALTEEHDEHAVGIIIPVENNLSSQYVIEKRRSLVIPNAQTDPMTEPIHERMRQRRTYCLAIIPLLSGGDVIGTIGLDTTDPDHIFSDEEIRLGETMANQMANAIQNARLFEATQQRARETTIINEMAREISGELDTVKLFARVYESLPRLMRSEAFIVWLYDEATQTVTRPVLYDLGKFYPDDEPPRAPSETISRVLAAVSPVYRNLTREQWEAEKARTEVIVGSSDPSASLLYTPLRVGNRVRGVMSVQSYQFNAYGERQAVLLTSVAHYVASAVENAQLFAETRAALAETQTLYEISARLNAANTIQETLEAAAGPAIVQGTSTATLLTLIANGADEPQVQRVAIWPRQTAEPNFPGTRFSAYAIAGVDHWMKNPYEPFVSENIQTDARVNDLVRAEYLQNEIHAAVVLPLKVSERWIGVLQFGWKETHEFTGRDIRLFRSTMAQAATVLDNRSLFEQTQYALAQTQNALDQVERAQQRLNLQYQTASILTRAVTFDQVIVPLLQNICRSLDWQIGEYWTMDQARAQIVLAHAWSSEQQAVLNFSADARSLAFSPGEGLAGRTWAERKAVWITDIAQDASFKQGDIAAQAGLCSALAFPLGNETRQFGVTIFFSQQRQEVDDALLATMVGVNNQIAQFLERKRAEGAMHEQNTYLMALHDTTLGLMRRLDVDELLQNIITRAGELVGTEHGYVHLLEPINDELRMRVGVGIYQDFVGTRVKRGQGLAGMVWRDGAPIVVDDYRYWSGRLPMVDRDVLRAVIGVPLKSGEQTVGVLGLASLEGGRKFGEAQIEALNRFAELAAVALDNARLYNESQKALEQTQRLARREKASAEITDKLYAATDVPSLLQTAVEELRRSTGSRRAVVRLNLGAEQSTGNGHEQRD